MTIKCELTMLTFTKTKNTRLPDSVHNAGVTLQSRDIPHTLPSPIFNERAPAVIVLPFSKFQKYFYFLRYLHQKFPDGIVCTDGNYSCQYNITQ
jgi:hypothetical protein